MSRLCRVCGKEIAPPRFYYCSHKCERARKNSRRRIAYDSQLNTLNIRLRRLERLGLRPNLDGLLEKECVVCGKMFTTSDSRIICCGPGCRQARRKSQKRRTQ
jgi:predicted nucleic acid-binding Zn ribbon protein